MDPREYVPLYLEQHYICEHPELTDAARSLLHEEVARQPEAYATTPHARALLSHMRAHEALMGELWRLEELPDEEFEHEQAELFGRARVEFSRICQEDPLCVDARLLEIQLADIPLDDCIGDMLGLEAEVRKHLVSTRAGFDPNFDTPPNPQGTDDADAAKAVATDPEVIGWLHVLEALAHGCLITTRYRAAAGYARQVMRAPGYPNIAVGTLLLALARLEDEEGFFEAVSNGGDGIDDLPWFLLGRTLLLYKLGRTRSAKRALKDFVARCDGGAFFLLNPTFHDPYLPVRPAPRERWDLAHQAVWEADGIIADTPDFTVWAASVEGVQDAARAFARRNGF